MSSPRTIGYLMRLIEDGNCRFADKKRREIRRLRVYDVVDDADEEIEESKTNEPVDEEVNEEEEKS